MSENTHQFINSTPINDLKSQEKPDTNQNSPKISLLHHMKKNAVPSGNTETTHHQISSVNIGGVLSRDAWYIFKESGQLDVDLLADVWPGEVINQSSTTPFTRAFKFNINLLSKSELQRLDVVHELISTEEDYVRDLGVVVDVFWGNARAMNVIGDADCDVIFSNLKEIRDVHLLWLDRFRARRKRDYGLIQQIGDLLIDMVIKHTLLIAVGTGMLNSILFFLERRIENISQILLKLHTSHASHPAFNRVKSEFFNIP